MKLQANNIAVDSGTIFICDMDFYKKQNGPKKRPTDSMPRKHLIETFKVPKGTYDISWVMPNTWMGEVKGKGKVVITSGKLVVADPCYLVPDKRWSLLLDETNYFRDFIEEVVVLDRHGGDGSFTVNIELTGRKYKGL